MRHITLRSVPQFGTARYRGSILLMWPILVGLRTAFCIRSPHRIISPSTDGSVPIHKRVVAASPREEALSSCETKVLNLDFPAFYYVIDLSLICRLGLVIQNAAGASESTTSHQTIIQFVKVSKAKSHKKHGPCEVGLTKSVEYLLQPENYMNFTKFSLDYVLQEQQHYSNNSMLQPKFGGHQTLEERENSYYARNETLHCGFVKGPEGYPSTGFDVNEKDKEYMARCRVAVSSCIFGSSDFLRRPTSKLIGTYSKKNVCFLMFLDELTMRKLSLEGQVPDDEGYIGLWKIVLVKKLPYTDMRKTGKVPKFLSHRLFPSAW
ncbi:hypothetical protein MA16_Dca010469 [Dendrobium catenatum]|uniref:TOD1/MUCI70 glycosyltransferase-like domain-containing protein n=1 Tax=Dendrobium catenatum TaxID=906689 RepID=A0A2I0XBM5_9ASPA|nr:hypothetical protein MA16_Dca010469 [Dendrobium catenatum]